MTSLDLLLSLVRVTAVGIPTIIAGYWLLRRRPDVVPSLSLAGLFSDCVLLAVAGIQWRLFGNRRSRRLSLLSPLKLPVLIHPLRQMSQAIPESP